MGAPCSKEQAFREAAPILAKIVLEGRARQNAAGASRVVPAASPEAQSVVGQPQGDLAEAS